VLDGNAEARAPSVTNVGYRPTFVEGGDPEGERERRIEVHLLEAPPPHHYGRTLEAEFVRKLRDERKFASDEDLAAQIARDVEKAGGILAEGDAR
jgi:riboflavin kinase/FMN adenylyltransferase